MENKDVKRLLIVISAICLLTGSMIARIAFPIYIEDITEAWFTQPISEASYIMGRYNSTHYYARNNTGYGTSGNEGYEQLSSTLHTMLEGLIDTGLSFYFTEETFSLTGEIDVVDKDDVTITFASWDAVLLQTGEPMHIFEITNSTGWKFFNVHTKSEDEPTSPDQEKGHYFMHGCSYMYWENCYSEDAYGYGWSPVPSANETPSVHHTLVNCRAVNATHCAVKWNGVWYSQIYGGLFQNKKYGYWNTLNGFGANKTDEQETIVIGRNDAWNTSGCYNLVHGAVIDGGQIGVNIAPYNSTDLNTAAYNTIQSCTIINIGYFDWNVGYEIRVAGNNNAVLDCTLIRADNRSGMVTNSIKIEYDAGPSAHNGTKIFRNTVTNAQACAIKSGTTTNVYATMICYNRVYATPSAAVVSIYIQDADSDYIIAIGNIMREDISVSGNANGNVTLNLDHVPD